MSCQHFETIITDLAREQLMDAAARERALAHAETCARCAARLADERTLTAGLQATAGAREEAPARVETALRAAFRRHIDIVEKTPAAVNSTPANTWRWSRRWVGAAAAAAAVFGVVFSLTALRSKDTTPSVQTEEASVITRPSPREDPTPELEKFGVSPSPRVAEPVSYGPNFRRQQSPLTRAANRARQPARDDDVSARPNAVAGGYDSAPESGDTEIRTDFLPLTHETNLASMHNAQVVRVEMPRSALVSFGLPMNMERSGERVKADVLLGEDGVARAIRFVR